MSIYLLPPSSALEEVVSVLSKVGVKVQQFRTMRELILAEGSSPIVVGTLDAQGLLILNRYAPSLVRELPTIVMSAPGAIYTGEWVSLASALPAVDWTELAQKVAKSGHLALSPDDLPTRRVGGSVPSVAQATGLSPRLPTRTELEPEADESDETDI